MKLGLDAYAHLDSLLHRWETRTKLIALLALIFSFAAVQSLLLLIPMVVATAVLFRLSRLPFTYLRQRLVLPGYFLLGLILSFPFLVAGGTPLLTVGPVTIWQEGAVMALLVTVRFLCIITVSLVLFGTAPFLTSIKALRALGLPLIMTDMILLTYRYLFEMSVTLNTTRTAVRLRGFQSDFSMNALSVLAALIGSLLVRSYEQADRVYHAMILRGYGHDVGKRHDFVTRKQDWLLATAVVAIAAVFIAAQVFLGNL